MENIIVNNISDYTGSFSNEFYQDPTLLLDTTFSENTVVECILYDESGTNVLILM